jgi:ATPase involved in DNA repair
LREVSAKRKELREKVDELENRRDILEYQQKQIDKVSPQAGEEEGLEERRQTLRHQEDLRQHLDRTQSLLLEADG